MTRKMKLIKINKVVHCQSNNPYLTYESFLRDFRSLIDVIESPKSNNCAHRNSDLLNHTQVSDCFNSRIQLIVALLRKQKIQLASLINCYVSNGFHSHIVSLVRVHIFKADVFLQMHKQHQ